MWFENIFSQSVTSFNRCLAEQTLKHFFIKIFFIVFKFLAESHGIWDLQLPDQVQNPYPLYWKCGVLNSRLPAKSPDFILMKSDVMFFFKIELLLSSYLRYLCQKKGHKAFLLCNFLINLIVLGFTLRAMILLV